jgi:hypothetical protein
MKETVILGEFNSLVEGMEYMNNTNDKFIFIVGNIIYSIDGVELTTEETLKFITDDTLKTLDINTMTYEIYPTPTEGQLFIKNNILFYLNYGY